MTKRLTTEQRQAAVKHAQGAHGSTWDVYCPVCRGDSKPLPEVNQSMYVAVTAIEWELRNSTDLDSFAYDRLATVVLGLKEALEVTGDEGVNETREQRNELEKIEEDWFDRWMSSRQRATRLRAIEQLKRMA